MCIEFCLLKSIFDKNVRSDGQVCDVFKVYVWSYVLIVYVWSTKVSGTPVKYSIV